MHASGCPGGGPAPPCALSLGRLCEDGWACLPDAAQPRTVPRLLAQTQQKPRGGLGSTVVGGVVRTGLACPHGGRRGSTHGQQGQGARLSPPGRSQATAAGHSGHRTEGTQGTARLSPAVLTSWVGPSGPATGGPASTCWTAEPASPPPPSHCRGAGTLPAGAEPQAVRDGASTDPSGAGSQLLDSCGQARGRTANCPSCPFPTEPGFVTQTPPQTGDQRPLAALLQPGGFLKCLPDGDTDTAPHPRLPRLLREHQAAAEVTVSHREARTHRWSSRTHKGPGSTLPAPGRPGPRSRRPQQSGSLPRAAPPTPPTHGPRTRPDAGTTDRPGSTAAATAAPASRRGRDLHANHVLTRRVTRTRTCGGQRGPSPQGDHVGADGWTAAVETAGGRVSPAGGTADTGTWAWGSTYQHGARPVHFFPP